MSLSLITPATGLPVTVEEVAAHCRVDAPTAEDHALLDIYIRTAAEWAFGAHGWTGRSLLNEVYDVSFDTWAGEIPRSWKGYEGAWRGPAELRLPRAKVQSVTSITYVDTDGADQTLAADQYRLVDRHGAGVVVPAYNVTWPTLRPQEAAVTVRFTAGYGADWNAIPQDLRTGLAQLTAFLWENRTTAVPDLFVPAFRKFQVSWSV
jgi:hypothetical protein